MIGEIQIELADPHCPDVRDLVTFHLTGMQSQSPPDCVHALAVDAFADETISLFLARVAGSPAGCGALRMLGDGAGEIKTMRVYDQFLGQGIGKAMLKHLIKTARDRGLRVLQLETGTTERFTAATRLYEQSGFTPCGPFADYKASEFSRFMRLEL